MITAADSSLPGTAGRSSRRPSRGLERTPLLRQLRVPEQYGTIQRAIWAARPGDTVLVAEGVYQETVHVDRSKERIELVASGHVLIDARPGGVLGGGPGIWIEARGVTVRGFTIQRSRRTTPDSALPGCGVYSTGEWTVLENLELRDCADAGLLLLGADSCARDCHVINREEPSLAF